MQLNDYQTVSKTSAIYPEQGKNLWYPTLGIIGEYLEWKSATSQEDKLKESGDFAWYCAQAFTELHESLDLILNFSEPVNEDFVYIMNLTEGVKKYYRDGKSAEKIKLIKHSISGLWRKVISDDDQAQILSTNLTKIADRKARKVLNGDGDNR